MEMAKTQRLDTHICYRQSYNLVYEVIRGSRRGKGRGSSSRRRRTTKRTIAGGKSRGHKCVYEEPRSRDPLACVMNIGVEPGLPRD